VLDFVNKAEDIQEAFKPYYEATIVEEVTELHKLYVYLTYLIKKAAQGEGFYYSSGR